MLLTQGVKPLQPPANITIGYHQNHQIFYGVTANILPLLGAIAAIVLAFYRGIGWLEIALLGSFYLLTMLGLVIGYHRLFSHHTFETSATVKAILAILGSMGHQGSIIHWVSTHRRHHQYTDRPGDPHSPYCREDKQLQPLAGFWNAQVRSMFFLELSNPVVFAKDILQDHLLLRISNLYYVWLILGFVLPTLLGGLISGTGWGYLSGFLWGGWVRLLLSQQLGSTINSINHLWGDRPFQTGDRSTNNICFAIPTLGESWHNNHHAFPNSAKFGLQWWQIDFGYWAIRVLEITGLAWNVKTPSPEAIRAKALS